LAAVDTPLRLVTFGGGRAIQITEQPPTREAASTREGGFLDRRTVSVVAVVAAESNDIVAQVVKDAHATVGRCWVVGE
jgi:hypothetical protein